MCRCLRAELSIGTAVPLRDANAQRIGVEPTSPGSGLELTPAINDGQAGMPSLSSRDQPKSGEESDESSTASDTLRTFYSTSRSPRQLWERPHLLRVKRRSVASHHLAGRSSHTPLSPSIWTDYGQPYWEELTVRLAALASPHARPRLLLTSP